MQGGHTNETIPTYQQSANWTDHDTVRADGNKATNQNEEPYEELNIATGEVPGQSQISSTCCKMHRKNVIMFVAIGILFIMILIAMSVYFLKPNIKINASGWANWSSWGSCSVNIGSSCGTGTQERLRLCTASVENSGESVCPGSDRQTQNCTIDCPSSIKGTNSPLLSNFTV